MDGRNGKLSGLRPETQESGGAGASPVDIAAQRFDQSIDAIVVDPREWVKASVRRVKAMNYPSVARTAQAAVLISSFEPVARELIAQWNLTKLRLEIFNFERDARLLAAPIPVPTFAANLQAHHKAMEAAGWLSIEIEGLWKFAAGGPGGQDKVISYNADCVNLESGRTVNRREIRDIALLPAGTPLEEWRMNPHYLSYKQAHEDALAAEQAHKAEQVVRYSSGPARIIGKPITA